MEGSFVPICCTFGHWKHAARAYVFYFGESLRCAPMPLVPQAVSMVAPNFKRVEAAAGTRSLVTRPVCPVPREEGKPHK